MGPKFPQKIIDVMNRVRWQCDYVTTNLNLDGWKLKEAEALITNDLAFLAEEMETFRHLYDKAEEKYESAKDTAFTRIKEKKETDGYAKIQCKIETQDLRLEMLEAKYPFKVLSTFCNTRKDIVNSLIHRIKALDASYQRGSSNMP
jgi:hypothetical protein